MNMEPFDSIAYFQCNGNFVECNKKCLEVYNQDMKLWPPADTPAKEVYTSSDLANCITRADRVAFSDIRNVAHELNFPKGQFKERATVAQCNGLLAEYLYECQVSFSTAIEDCDVDHSIS
jgi:hypothetical protein